MEFQYSARCGEAINKAFDVPIGRPFRLCMCVTCSDWYGNRRYCVKVCRCRLIKTLRPDSGTSHSNEVIIIFTGEASAVKTAVTDARSAGMQLLRSLGSEPLPVTKPYI